MTNEQLNAILYAATDSIFGNVEFILLWLIPIVVIVTCWGLLISMLRRAAR